MLSKFWESLGSNLAKRWIEYVFGPAFLFWAGGFGIYTWKTGWQEMLTYLQGLTQLQQGAGIVSALLVLVFSSLVLNALRFPILRILEGYWPWPFHYLGLGIIELRKKFFKKKYGQLRELKAKESTEELSSAEQQKLSELDTWAHWHPVQAAGLLPTALGNIMRARERGSERKYSLDAVVCWPRLWSLLPENVRDDLVDARSSLERMAELWFWGLLFLIWNFWTPWALLIGLLWMVLAYGMALQVTMAYGDLIEAAFDIHRMKLYDALGWPRPKNRAEEKKMGAQLTEFLWRGTMPGNLEFEHPE